MFDDHIPGPPGFDSDHPEELYGELRSGRPEGGIRFPRDEDDEPHLEAQRRLVDTDSGEASEADAESDTGDEDAAGGLKSPRSIKIERDFEAQSDASTSGEDG